MLHCVYVVCIINKNTYQPRVHKAERQNANIGATFVGTLLIFNITSITYGYHFAVLYFNYTKYKQSPLPDLAKRHHKSTNPPALALAVMVMASGSSSACDTALMQPIGSDTHSREESRDAIVACKRNVNGQHDDDQQIGPRRATTKGRHVAIFLRKGSKDKAFSYIPVSMFL